ncbi:Spindle assembly abnormal protein [Dirofilaria immitis]
MEKIHYPIRKNIVEQQSNQRPANDNKVEDLNRPYTAGTIDSGCPEDACSVILSPNNNRKDDGIESVVLDVTDCSNSNSAASSKIQNSRSAPSIIHDLSSFSINETNMASPSSSNFGSNDRIMQKMSTSTSVEGSIAGNLERIESQVGDVILPETSENSQDTDGTRSRHWRRVISEFTSEAMKKTELPIYSTSAKEEFSSPSSSNEILGQISKEIPYFINFMNRRSPEEIQRKSHAMQERLSSIFSEEIEGDVYAHVKKIENNVKKANTMLLETSLENQISKNISEGKTMGSSVTERNLAKQLKDLIAHINLARECRHHEYEKLEEIFDEALQENEFFRQQVNELKKRILQLEDDKQTQLENFALKEEAEKIRNADIERLRRENSILNQQRKQKDGSDTAFVNLLKEQISDLRIMVRDFDRQRSELRMQIRKSNTVLKEKNEIIEQLKSEKARLEKRIEVITKNKAAHRGRLAENSLSAQAIARASKNATVTTTTKDLTISNNKFFITNSMDGGKHISQISNVPSRIQNTVNVVENTDTISDNEDVIVAEHRVIPVSSGKNVRWNEPLATMASFSSPPSVHSALNPPNSDMQLILTENNMIGKASLYRSEKDFTVYTVTHCGCHFYEYSNTDTRWIHSSKLYQVNYYGQAGATTVEVGEGKLLVRHFLTGQLEIYREGGETTLITPGGRRMEVVKDKSGSVRIEIYELDGRVRVRGHGGVETEYRTTQTSCHRMDGSYANHIASDDSVEWRSPDYTIHRFKSGDTKVRLNLIDTSITMLVMDVGTVKHLSNPLNRRLPKYCVEWGTVARKRSRVIAATQSHVLNQL